MNNIKDIISKYELESNRYTIKKNATIIDTDDGHFVFKKKNHDDKLYDLFKYLESRSFPYFPNLINNDERYDIYEYIEDVNLPREQRALDMMYVISILHYKTTYYKDIDEDEIKAMYEDVLNKIDYIYNYYNDLIAVIECKIYMSPSEYLIARNISKIFQTIVFCRREIDSWYDIVKSKHKKRVVTLHNNLDIDHLIENQNLYLLSWEKSKQDIPIYDLLDFYKRYALEFDFTELFKTYESKYKLLSEEKKLLFVLMSIPDVITLDNSEIENCRKARRLLDYIFKTEILLTPYYTIEDKKE